MGSESPKRSNALFRKLAVAILFALINILRWHASFLPALDRGDDPTIGLPHAPTDQEGNKLMSGVGLVTTDGMWGNETAYKYTNEEIKILGFTDKYYLPIARLWYNRLTALGYTEHWIVAHDREAHYSLLSDHYRVIPCIIENPQYSTPVKGLWQQIMAARLKLTTDLLRNGTHLLITDVDNVFSRHVPLHGFLEQGYDVYHAFEMFYPTWIYHIHGFVICSGHQFLRSSPETLNFMDLVMDRCRGKKCDDQNTYNEVFFWDLNITWDNNMGRSPATREGALRVNSTGPESNNLLVESATGRSPVTNHTIKIWDRDFAWRLADAIPDLCPSANNWVGMPTKVNNALTGGGDKIQQKLRNFDVWYKHCMR